MKIFEQDSFTRSQESDKTVFVAEASDLELGSAPEAFQMEANDGALHTFTKTSTLRDGTPDNEIYGWTYRNKAYGERVVVTIFND